MSSLGTLQRRPRKAYGPAVQQWLPARETEEVAELDPYIPVADVVWRYECWELMLELGGLADARPMTYKATVYNHYIHTVIQWWHCGPRL